MQRLNNTGKFKQKGYELIMNCWHILGIEPTVDLKTIKKAYALKLRIHHPEDDPEGFNRLRSAYEAALL